MKYFTYLQSNNAPNNKLQTVALELLKDKSNLLITDRNAFLSDLDAAVSKLNEEHPKCTSLRFWFWDAESSKAGRCIGVSLGTYTVGFYLYPVLEQVKEVSA